MKPGRITYTTATSGSGRKFSYKDLDTPVYGDCGKKLVLANTYTSDWDGRYCDEADMYGNTETKKNASSSVLGWVAVEYVGC